MWEIPRAGGNAAREGCERIVVLADLKVHGVDTRDLPETPRRRNIALLTHFGFGTQALVERIFLAPHLHRKSPRTPMIKQLPK